MKFRKMVRSIQGVSSIDSYHSCFALVSKKRIGAIIWASFGPTISNPCSTYDVLLGICAALTDAPGTSPFQGHLVATQGATLPGATALEIKMAATHSKRLI